MRRFIPVAVAIISVMAFFAACAFFQDEPIDPITDFAATAKVTENENVFSCEVSNTKEGVASVMLTAPETLQGLCFKWLGGDACSIEYKDLFCQSNTEYLPATSFASALIHVLSACSLPEQLSIKQREKAYTCFLGTCESGDFIITCDNQTGFIQKVEINELSLIVELQDQKAFT